ncbi:P2 family phage major capsid protein [Oleidesulfovibrio alaskensis]|uniref:P2 family phage major capsid protein n=1 Tax=Oleidesulfovibrio alaskensis TaxID=58180 RepID=UPI000404DDD7|nr:P2 family phage major capsid protein [Oleidesulfovibrio alaskensis]
MQQSTRQLFNAMLARFASTYGVQDVQHSFSVTPSIAQKLQDKIVEQSTFLSKINMLPVDELKGQNILGFAASPVTSRTDTSQPGKERQPRNVMGLEARGYELHQTNADVSMPYRLIDVWAKFPDFAERYARYVQQRMANDMEIIGWYGTSAAADTDMQTNPLLQDVNKGWLQYMRDNLPANILSQGNTANELRIGAGGDWANLDIAVNDMLQGIPQYTQTTTVQGARAVQAASQQTTIAGKRQTQIGADDTTIVQGASTETASGDKRIEAANITLQAAGALTLTSSKGDGTNLFTELLACLHEIKAALDVLAVHTHPATPKIVEGPTVAAHAARLGTHKGRIEGVVG